VGSAHATVEGVSALATLLAFGSRIGLEETALRFVAPRDAVEEAAAIPVLPPETPMILPAPTDPPAEESIPKASSPKTALSGEPIPLAAGVEFAEPAPPSHEQPESPAANPIGECDMQAEDVSQPIPRPTAGAADRSRAPATPSGRFKKGGARFRHDRFSRSRCSARRGGCRRGDAECRFPRRQRALWWVIGIAIILAAAGVGGWLVLHARSL